MIPVTIPMLDAGAEVIWAELGTVNMGAQFSATDFAARIYEAMQPLAPRPASEMKFKLDTSGMERCVAEFTATVAEFKAAVEAATAEDDGPHRG